MVVGEMAEAVDLLVIGGGPGGYAAALRAAQLGRDVVLVDRDGLAGLGGTCVRVGCIPSKALIELAEAARLTTRWATAGLITGTASVDLNRFQDWKNGLVSDLNHGLQFLFGKAGITVIAGTATFNKPNQIAVATTDGNARFLQFRHAVLATGSRPAALGVLPRDGERVIDSTDALGLTAVPAELVVIGTGYIGLELGTAFAKLGSKVTLIEQLDRILPAVDAAITAPVRRACRDLGMDLLTSTEVIGADGRDVIVKTGAGERRISADKIVVAVGRLPEARDIGAAAAGLTLDEAGRLVTDASCLASRTVAAIGDVARGPALAHKAMAEADVAVRSLCGQRARFEPQAIPMVVFSDPEIALVGLTESQARDDGLTVRVGQFPLAASGRAGTLGVRTGFVRVVLDAADNTVVGVQLVGPHVSELAAEAALAIEMGATATDLAATIHPHPTISEAISEAAGVALGFPLHLLRD